MPSIHLVWNPKHIIVQWVGIGTHTHTLVSDHCIEIQGDPFGKTQNEYIIRGEL